MTDGRDAGGRGDNAEVETWITPLDEGDAPFDEDLPVSAGSNPPGRPRLGCECCERSAAARMGFDDAAPSEVRWAAVSGMYQPGEVEVALEEGLSIVRLLGEHDISTQQIVAARLVDLIATGNPLVLDVSQATFVDSSFANAVARAKRELAKRGVRVALVVPDSAARVVSKLIELAKVEQHILIVRSQDEAKQILLARPAD